MSNTDSVLGSPAAGGARVLGMSFPFYYGWVIVAAAATASVGAVALTPIVFSLFVAPMTEELDLGRSAISWAFSARLVASGLTAPLVGILLDRVGPRWLGVVGGLVAGGSVIALSFANSLWLVCLLLAVSGSVGFGGGVGAQPLVQVPVAKWFVAKRGRAMAITAAVMAGAVVLSVPFVQWLISASGWRNTWLVLGVLLASITIPAYGLLMRRSPEDIGLRPDGAPAGDPSHLSKARQPQGEPDWTLGEAFRTPALWLILVAFALLGAGLAGTNVHRIAYQQGIGITPGLIALGTAMDPMLTIPSVFLFGWISERVHPRQIGIVAGAGYSLSIIALMLAQQDMRFIFAHNIIMGISSGAYISCYAQVWPAYYGRRFVGTIVGVSTPVVIAGAGAGAPLAGYLFDAGLTNGIVWLVFAGVFAGASVALAVVRKPQRSGARMAAQPAS